MTQFKQPPPPNKIKLENDVDANNNSPDVCGRKKLNEPDEIQKELLCTLRFLQIYFKRIEKIESFL